MPEELTEAVTAPQPITPQATNSNDVDVVEDENARVQEIDKKYRVTPKFTRWVVLFNDKENKYGHNTFGNQTKSALIAYNLNPETQTCSAAVIGSENFRKLKVVAKSYCEKQGFTLGRVLDILMAKVIKSDNPGWLDRLNQVTDMFEQANTQPAPAVQNNYTQNNYFTVPEEQRRDWDAEFKQFLEGKKPPAPLTGETTPDLPLA